MSDKSNNPFQFWEELKRRRVIRVITMYAATAFIVLEPFGQYSYRPPENINDGFDVGS